MAKTLKQILKQKKWTPRDLGLAVLYNLKHDLEEVENFPPLFPQEQLNEMVNTIGKEGMPELKFYDLLNHAIINNRNIEKALLQQAFHGYYKYSTLLLELSREVSIFQEKIKQPFVITEEYYGKLSVQLCDKIGAEQVSYFRIFFDTLDYFLTEHQANYTLPPEIREALDGTKEQAVTNPRIIENYVHEMRLVYYVDSENGEKCIPLEELQQYKEEQDKDKPTLTAEQRIELMRAVSRFIYENDELAIIQKLRSLPNFTTAKYPTLTKYEVEEGLTRIFHSELYPDTKGARIDKYILKNELPADINKYDILINCIELYNGAHAYTLKNGFSVKTSEREQLKEFKADYPALYAALDKYIREHIPEASELKANQLFKPITTMSDLLRSQYSPAMASFNFDDIRLQELFSSDSEEDFITCMKISNGVAVASDLSIAVEENHNFESGVFELKPYIKDFITFKDLTENTEVCECLTGAYELIEEALRQIYAYNDICNIIIELLDVPFLKDVLTEDLSSLEDKFDTINNLIYSLHLTPPVPPVKQKKARESIKTYLKAIDYKSFRPSDQRVQELRRRMFYAYQEGFPEISSYILASRQLMKTLGAAKEAE